MGYESKSVICIAEDQRRKQMIQQANVKAIFTQQTFSCSEYFFSVVGWKDQLLC